jgi:hypothetical protein
VVKVLSTVASSVDDEMKARKRIADYCTAIRGFVLGQYMLCIVVVAQYHLLKVGILKNDAITASARRRCWLSVLSNEIVDSHDQCSRYDLFVDLVVLPTILVIQSLPVRCSYESLQQLQLE